MHWLRWVVGDVDLFLVLDPRRKRSWSPGRRRRPPCRGPRRWQGNVPGDGVEVLESPSHGVPPSLPWRPPPVLQLVRPHPRQPVQRLPRRDMLKRIHALRPIGDRRLYFQSLLYNMRGFWSLHTLPSTHTLPHPVAPGRTTSPHTSLYGAVTHSSMPTRSPRSWSATVHLSASTGAAL